MILSEVMTREVETIGPDASIQDAAKKMQVLNIGMLPVWENHKLWGTVTDRDIAIRAVALGRDPWKTRVREIMTSEVIACYDDQPVDVAARLMEQNGLHRVLILNRANEPVGVFSIGDLAVETHDDRLTGEVLRCVSELYHHKHQAAGT
jgi:CBS domain-containing protein